MELNKSKPEWSIMKFLAVVATKKCLEIVSSKDEEVSLLIAKAGREKGTNIHSVWDQHQDLTSFSLPVVAQHVPYFLEQRELIWHCLTLSQWLRSRSHTGFCHSSQHAFIHAGLFPLGFSGSIPVRLKSDISLTFRQIQPAPGKTVREQHQSGEDWFEFVALFSLL